MRRHVVLRLLIFIGLITFHATAQAQSTEATLKARLKDKQLYLRGCWGGARLRFDPEGRLIGSANTTSFTLSGFELRSLAFKNGKLTLEGKRMGIEFIKGKQRLVPIHMDDPKIEIDAPANGDCGPALDAIFAEDLATLSPTLPVYWERWGRRNFPAAYVGRPVSMVDEPQPGEEDRPTLESAKPKKVGGSVHPPQLEQHFEAEFDKAARKLKFSGKTVLRLIVDTEGRPRHIRIDKPLGFGLDEEAVNAVGQYLFSQRPRTASWFQLNCPSRSTFRFFSGRGPKVLSEA